jgi:hypothetical protein
VKKYLLSQGPDGNPALVDDRRPGNASHTNGDGSSESEIDSEDSDAAFDWGRYGLDLSDDEFNVFADDSNSENDIRTRRKGSGESFSAEFDAVWSQEDREAPPSTETEAPPSTETVAESVQIKAKKIETTPEPANPNVRLKKSKRKSFEANAREESESAGAGRRETKTAKKSKHEGGKQEFDTSARTAGASPSSDTHSHSQPSSSMSKVEKSSKREEGKEKKKKEKKEKKEKVKQK